VTASTEPDDLSRGAPSDAAKIAANRAMWDERVPIHTASRFYDVDGFKAGRNDLRGFERELVGPVEGLDLVHLQCHFGLDTLSWARLGARVVGVDFSEPAIDAARRLADEIGIDADFVVSDVYDAVDALDGRSFDVVYTGLGALLWLPDLDRWAEVVSSLLRPGGIVFVAEFHPVHAMLADDDLTITHSYFGGRDGLRWDDPGTYADLDAPTEHNEQWEFTHPVSSVIASLLDRGLALEVFREYPFTLWPRWPFLVQRDDRSWWMPEDRPQLPLIYAIRMRRPT
jgi:SAM-dependent methyltransferase